MLPEEVKAIGVMMIGFPLVIGLVIVAVVVVVGLLVTGWDSLVETITELTGSPLYIDATAFYKRKDKVSWMTALGAYLCVALFLILV